MQYTPGMLEVQADLRTQIESTLEHWDATRQTAAEGGLELLGGIIEDARRLGDSLLLGRSLVAVAQAQVVRGNCAETLKLAAEALEWLSGHDETAALAHQVIGRAQYDLGNDERALEAMERALTLRHDEHFVLHVQGNIAAIQIELGRLREAIATHEFLLERAAVGGFANREPNLRSNLSLALGRLAHELGTSGQQAEASELRQRAKLEAERAIACAQSDGQQDVESHVRRTLADLCEIDGDRTEAEHHLHESLRLARAIESPWNELHSLSALSKLLLETGDPVTALSFAEQSLERAEKMGYKDHMAHAHHKLSLIHEHLGDYREALRHARRHHDLDTTVKSEAASRRAETLAVQMQVERAQLEAQLNRQRSEELAHLNAQLELQAATDALTGLANRRALTMRLEAAFQESRASGAALTVALFDLDHFKSINDSHSHAVGDAVLSELGRLLRHHCRAGDFVARYGGEEFALVLPGVSGLAALELCERLRAAIAAHGWNQISAGLGITASFGYCDDPTLEHHERLLAGADAWLYEAKRLGRNQVQPTL